MGGGCVFSCDWSLVVTQECLCAKICYHLTQVRVLNIKNGIRPSTVACTCKPSYLG